MSLEKLEGLNREISLLVPNLRKNTENLGKNKENLRKLGKKSRHRDSNFLH